LPNPIFIKTAGLLQKLDSLCTDISDPQFSSKQYEVFTIENLKRDIAVHLNLIPLHRELKMKTRIRIYPFLIVLVAMLTVFIVSSMAQEKPADNMQIVREKIQTDKKLFIAENMNLTESEAKVFWPVYENYQKDLGKLVDKTVKLIDNYAANYETMTDEAAKELINGYLTIEEERVTLMKSFLPKFRKVLPEKKVARYYQLENKINAVVKYGLATQIPLVN